MRKQLFINYLKDFLNDVSGSSTCNINKLVKKSKNNYRIRDSLILYCALSGESRTKLLLRFSNSDYFNVVTRVNEDNFLSDEFDDYDFKKIWDTYINKIKVYEYDDITKSQIHKNIIKKMDEKNISNYRVYKDLHLNPGNVNDYLTNGNVKKVSLETARNIYHYVCAY